MKVLFRGIFTLSLILSLAAILGSGCKSTPSQADWNARLGNYSYDQAVIDLGPPDKTARLEDGRTVAEWYTPANTGGGFSFGSGFGGYHGGVGMGTSIGTGGLSKVLRLVFGPDNRLVSWTKG